MVMSNATRQRVVEFFTANSGSRMSRLCCAEDHWIVMKVDRWIASLQRKETSSYLSFPWITIYISVLSTTIRGVAAAVAAQMASAY